MFIDFVIVVVGKRFLVLSIGLGKVVVFVVVDRDVMFIWMVK